MLTAGVLDALVLLDAPNLGFRGVLLLLAVLCAVGNWSPTVANWIPTRIRYVGPRTCGNVEALR